MLYTALDMCKLNIVFCVHYDTWLNNGDNNFVNTRINTDSVLMYFYYKSIYEHLGIYFKCEILNGNYL